MSLFILRVRNAKRMLKENEIMWTLLIAYVFQGIIFGVICSYVASTKGYNGGFAWGFFLGIIGLLVVGFRPNLTQASAEAYRPMYPDGQPKPKPQWECVCGAKNPESLDYCLSCRRERKPANVVEKVTCPHCGASNKKTNTLCFACNKPLQEEAPAPVEETKKDEQQAPQPQDSIPSLIEQLARLHAQGILTDEEFQQKKADLLARL